MLTKGFRILWLKLQISEHSKFGIPVPIHPYAIQELLDCFLDLLTLISFFLPKRSTTGSSSSFGVLTLKELVFSIMKLLDSITEGEPYDLVDISTGKVRVSIKVR